MADVEHGKPVAPGMRFRIGSVTKQFTAAMVEAAEASEAVGASVAEAVESDSHPGAIFKLGQLLG